MNPEINADIASSQWRKLDIKLVVDGELHVLRWRRKIYFDEVFFDDRRVAVSKGWFNRDTAFGLALKDIRDRPIRLLLTIDPVVNFDNWRGNSRLRGVRLETAYEKLIAYGSLGPDSLDPFRLLYERAVRAIGLS